MSEVSARRFPIIAMACAVAALGVSVVAAVVVVTREHGDAGGAAVEDHEVNANDVVKLTSATVDMMGGSVYGGARVKDTALATALGLGPNDVITAISGRTIHRDYDLHDIFFNTSLMRATTLYVELERDHKPMLVRWIVKGDLRSARRGAYDWAARPAIGGSVGGVAGGVVGGSLGVVPPPPPPPDPTDDDLTKDIVQIDDTHVELPKSTVDKILANPMAAAKGARMVPAIKNGKPNGFKLYAIRPSSLYAKLGFANGDTIESVNGFSLDDAQAALDVYTKLKDATVLELEISRRGRPLTLTITIK